MIIKSSQRGNGAQLAEYLLTAGENDEQPELLEMSGAIADRPHTQAGLLGFVNELEARAAGSRCQDIFFHATMSPGVGEPLTDDARRRSWETYETAHGLVGRPFAEVRHSKLGPGGRREDHYHRVYSLVDEHGRKTSTFRSKLKDELASRKIEHDEGFRFTPMVEPGVDANGRTRLTDHTAAVCRFARDRGMPKLADWISRHAAAIKVKGTAADRIELQQAARTGLTKAEVVAALGRAWDTSDSEKAFRQALEAEGLPLARGDRSAFILCDPGGGDHDLARLLAAHRKSQGEAIGNARARDLIMERLAGVDPTELPSAAQARALARAGLPVAGQPAGTPGPAPTLAEKVTATAKPAAPKGAFEAIGRSTCTDAELRRSCRRVAGGDPLKALKLYRAAIKSAELVTIEVGPNGERRYTSRALLSAERSLRAWTEEAKTGPTCYRLSLDGATVEAELAVFAASFRTEVDQATGGKVKDAALRDEQTAAVKRVLTGGKLTAVSGVAGAGKSTAMKAIYSAYRSQGIPVYGVAPSAKAAAGLGETGIPSTTIAGWLLRQQTPLACEAALREWHEGSPSKALDAKFLGGFPEKETTVRDVLKAKLQYALENPRGDNLLERFAFKSRIEARLVELDHHEWGWSKSTRTWVLETIQKEAAKTGRHYLGGELTAGVLVMDEAGMVDSQTMARVRETAGRLNMKVILVGDDQQLQAVGQGAPFRLVVEQLGAAELRDVARQKDAWMKEATQKFAEKGEGSRDAARAAMRSYIERGYVHGVGGRTSGLEDQATKALGRELTDAERRTLGLVSAYVDSRQEAGEAWSRITASTAPGGDFQAHEEYQAFRDAASRRDLAARSLAIDPEARKWLARCGVDRREFAADHLMAVSERMKRADAIREAGSYADRLGLLDKTPDFQVEADSRAEARAALIEQWSRDTLAGDAQPSSVILAYTRADVAALNEAARAEKRRAGKLGSAEVSIKTDDGPLALAAGDRVMFTKNQSGTELANGVFATVHEIEALRDERGNPLPPRVGVVIDGQKEITWISGEDYPHVTRGFAATVHKSQGATVDQCHVLASKGFDKHLFYVAMSRHKKECHVYYAKSELSEAGIIENAAKTKSNDLVSDHVDPRSLKESGIEAASARAAALKSTMKEEEFSHERSKAEARASAQAATRPGRSGGDGAGKSGDRNADARAARVEASRRDLAPAPAPGMPLCELSKVDLVHDTERAEGVLPRDEASHLDIERAGGSRDGLRRPGDRVTVHDAASLHGPAPAQPAAGTVEAAQAETDERKAAQTLAHADELAEEKADKAAHIPAKPDDQEKTAEAEKQETRQERAQMIEPGQAKAGGTIKAEQPKAEPAQSTVHDAQSGQDAEKIAKFTAMSEKAARAQERIEASKTAQAAIEKAVQEEKQRQEEQARTEAASREITLGEKPAVRRVPGYLEKIREMEDSREIARGLPESAKRRIAWDTHHEKCAAVHADPACRRALPDDNARGEAKRGAILHEQTEKAAEVREAKIAKVNSTIRLPPPDKEQDEYYHDAILRHQKNSNLARGQGDLDAMGREDVAATAAAVNGVMSHKSHLYIARGANYESLAGMHLDRAVDIADGVRIAEVSRNRYPPPISNEPPAQRINKGTEDERIGAALDLALQARERPEEVMKVKDKLHEIKHLWEKARLAHDPSMKTAVSENNVATAKKSQGMRM